MSVSIEQPKQTSSAGQTREQRLKVAFQPAVKGTIANPFEGEQNGKRDHFAGIETGLRMLLSIRHLVIHSAKQVGDKIFGSHESTLLRSDRLLE